MRSWVRFGVIRSHCGRAPQLVVELITLLRDVASLGLGGGFQRLLLLSQLHLAIQRLTQILELGIRLACLCVCIVQRPGRLSQ